MLSFDLQESLDDHFKAPTPQGVGRRRQLSVGVLHVELELGSLDELQLLHPSVCAAME